MLFSRFDKLVCIMIINAQKEFEYLIPTDLMNLIIYWYISSYQVSLLRLRIYAMFFSFIRSHPFATKKNV